MPIRQIRPAMNFETGESYDDLRNEVINERADVREAMERTKLKRALATMLVGLRKRKRLTQSQFADKAGWDKAFVSRIEGAGGGLPSLETIKHYATVCDAGLYLHVLGEGSIEGVVLAGEKPAREMLREILERNLYAENGAAHLELES